MFKQQGGFWLYFVGIIIMFLVLFYLAQSITGRNSVSIKKSPQTTITSKGTNVPNKTGNPIKTSTPSDSKQINTNNDYYAEINTNKGIFKVDLFERNAPNTVANFINLVNSGYYDGTKFYKLIPGVALQGGSKDNSPTGGPDYTIPDEINWDSLDYSEDLRLVLRSDGFVSAKKIASIDIDKDVLVMANPGPNKAGSQFIIILGTQNNPEVLNYRGRSTVFGKVIEGTSVIEKISIIPVDNSGAFPKPQDDIIINSVKIFIK